MSFMLLIMFLFLLVFVVGGIGIAFEALRWMLIIALILVVATLITGRRYW